MKAFILAAGIGRRLQPLTFELPKPLIPVNGIPLLCYTLMRLRQAGVNQLIINTCYLGEKIIHFLHYHADFGFEIHISEERELLGTGGGIKNCQHLLKEPFLLINADIICDIEIADLISFWQKDQQMSLLALSHTGTPSVATCGQLVADFSDLRKSGLADDLAYTGNALIMPDIFASLPDGASSLVTSGFIPLVECGQLGFWEYKSWWFDLGTYERLQQAERFLKTKKDINKILSSLNTALDQEYLNWMYRGLMEV
ncbi:MAG: nucleotidyltransferase family protein [Candidatus Cloacimonetes bacterium]|nr:nucleotidyltransferase family protein [Candidatus Cloacimonadota bacterium]